MTLRRTTIAVLHGIALLFLAAHGSHVVRAGDLVVSSDFEGGSVVVEDVDQDERVIRVSPSVHEDRGWVCWWYFRVTGIEPGETIGVDVGNGPWATPDRATFSLDRQRWEHTDPGRRNGRRIVYRQRVAGDTAWFAWGPPFTPRDAEQLCRTIAEGSPFAERYSLCRTRGGRSTPALRIEETESGSGSEDGIRYGVWIQARQHAWEAGSSWVCRGLVEWLVSDDVDAVRLRRSAIVHVVPIMDVDNVAIGAGGKSQRPQDHNRDWTDEPHWRGVAAAQQAVLLLDADGRFDLFVDLHNPGANDRRPFFFVPPNEELTAVGRRNLEGFVVAARTEIAGPLKLADRTRVSGANYDRNWQAISKNWVARHTRPHVVSATLETPWNTLHSTTKGYQRVGRELGEAIASYLSKSPRDE